MSELALLFLFVSNRMDALRGQQGFPPEFYIWVHIYLLVVSGVDTHILIDSLDF